MNRLYLDSLWHGFLPHTPPEKLCVVGDVHNNLGTFLGIARDFLAKNTGGRVIQLGDFCGDRMHFRDFLTGMIHREEMEKIHIVKWNHDSGMPTWHPMSLQDIWESDDGDILTIRWAATPAIARIQWRSYYGEELNEYQFNEILTLIRQRVKRPRVIITHDGPTICHWHHVA